MSRGVFRRPHFAPRYRRPLFLPSAPAAAPAGSLPLRVKPPVKAMLSGGLFRSPHFAPYYRKRAFLPSAPPVAAPVSLPPRVHPMRRLLAGTLFRPTHFPYTYRRPAFLPSLTPTVAPVSLPLRVPPIQRLLAGALFRPAPFAPYYRKRAFLPSLAPTAPVSRPPPSRPRRVWRLARPHFAPYYRCRARCLLPGPVPAAASIPLGKLAVFFSDFAVAASFGAQSAQVLRDAPDEQWLAGAVQSREYAITYAATQLPGLKTGDTLTVDGVSYRVREVSALDDGALMRATLTKP